MVIAEDGENGDGEWNIWQTLINIRYVDLYKK